MAHAVPRLAAAPGRVRFVDALRGLAVVLMVVNHTARWWLAPAVGDGREALIYTTMALAGPTFLLLVGFSLALGYHRATVAGGRPWRAVARRSLQRAAGIALAGFALNAVVFPDDLVGARVLLSIALALVVATPLLPLARRRAGRLALLVLAFALYAAFPPAAPALAAWSRAHPIAASLLFREFPLFPWLALVLLGVVLGWHEAAAPAAARRTRRYTAIGLGGLAALLAYAWLEPATPVAARLAFGRDLTLNDYWTAGPVTAVGITGALLALLALAYGVVERGGWSLPGLLLLGRAALVLYVVHLVVVVALVREAGGLVLGDWPSYAAATALLLVFLLALARAWLLLRGRWQGRRRLVPRPA